MKPKRYEQILRIVDAQRVVSIEELCDQLGVSKATIRRDLIYLDEKQQLKRTHGGAVSLVRPATDDVPIAIRHRIHKEAKEQIALAALTLIHEGSTLFIGSGTTLQGLAARLNSFSKLTIVTNDVGVAYEVAHRTANHLIVTGGKLRPATATLCGSQTEAMLRDMHVHTAFLSADSALPGRGFMDVNIEEVAIKRAMIAGAQSSVMLMDCSKFRAGAFVSICPLSDVDHTITNADIDPEIEQALVADGMKLHKV
ncbi:MAG: DeoR/GlpR family DNA-binding transcription regulator [Oscillospiraceae bacterium]|nr:DeoR/GlpR family DNA-binding transcription regulator [Oscillospiraceae bacterium]